MAVDVPLTPCLVSNYYTAVSELQPVPDSPPGPSAPDPDSAPATVDEDASLVEDLMPDWGGTHHW